MEDVYTYTINKNLVNEDKIDGIICYTSIRHLFLSVQRENKKYDDEFKFYKLTSNNISPYHNLTFKKICRNPINIEELINHYDKKSKYKFINNLKYNPCSPIMYIFEKYTIDNRLYKTFYWFRGNFIY